MNPDREYSRSSRSCWLSPHCSPGAGGGRDGDDEAGGDTAATTSESGGDLSGRIQADGSSTVGPYTTAAAESFQDVEPGVQVTVGVSGTGGGFERFCRGETDLSNASRAIKEEEIAACEQEGIEYVEFQVANDALTVVVNTENDWATCLTVEQLKTDLEHRLEGEQLEPGRRRAFPTSS